MRIERGFVKRFDDLLLKMVDGISKDKERRKCLLIQIAFICWIIWKERCAVVFKKKKRYKWWK